MRAIILIAVVLLLQSCGTQCGAAKWRNSNKYYGVEYTPSLKSNLS